MPLKQKTFNEKRIISIESIQKQISQNRDFQDTLTHMYELGVIVSKNIKENVDFIYGDCNVPEFDIEWEMCKVLFMVKVLKGSFRRESDFGWKSNSMILVSNVKGTITSLFKNDFKISWNETTNNEIVWSRHVPVATKTIVDNIKDIPENIADLITGLLQPNIKEETMVGFISKINANFEKKYPRDMKHLNEVDSSIYQKTWNLAKQIINNIDSAKGHKGRSELTIYDIAHNFALHASLLFKLIEINKQNKKGEKNE